MPWYEQRLLLDGLVADGVLTDTTAPAPPVASANAPTKRGGTVQGMTRRNAVVSRITLPLTGGELVSYLMPELSKRD